MNQFVLTYLNGPTLACGAAGAMLVQVIDSVTLAPQAGVAVTYSLSAMPPGASGAGLAAALDPTNALGYSTGAVYLGNQPGDYVITVSSSGMADAAFTFHATLSTVSTIWDAIKSNFVTVIEGTIPGITTNNFHSVAGFHGIEKLPTSQFDRAYHVHPKSLDKFTFYTNTVVDYEYTVKVEIGYVWNFNDGDTLLDTAIGEVEMFAKARVKSDSWVNTSIAYIEYAGSADIPPVENQEESLSFAKFELHFKVRGRAFY